MGITRLQLYNNALLLCGERFLASLDEDREPRRLLDQVWASNGINYCLERGQWHFAMRALQVDYDPAITPDFGYNRGFNKPDDWVNTSAVCSDEFFRSPLLEYADERGFWFASIDTIYVKIVSNSNQYGGDPSIWPATFCDYIAAYFASRILSKLAGDKSAQQTALFGPPGNPRAGILHETLHQAKNAAAMTQPTVFPAQGSWSRARRGARLGYRDRGNPGSLTG
jgi:hypothetical protein